MPYKTVVVADGMETEPSPILFPMHQVGHCCPSSEVYVHGPGNDLSARHINNTSLNETIKDYEFKHDYLITIVVQGCNYSVAHDDDAKRYYTA